MNNLIPSPLAPNAGLSQEKDGVRITHAPFDPPADLKINRLKPAEEPGEAVIAVNTTFSAAKAGKAGKSLPVV